MTLRYQIDPGEPLTFMDVKVGKQVRNPLAFIVLQSGIQLHSRILYCQPSLRMLLYCGRAMLHKLELATLMWPTSGVHLAALL